MHQLLPHLPDPSEPENELAQVEVQLNLFECGRIAIGLCVSHKIMDLGSFITFMKCWAGTTKGSTETAFPVYNAASLFPPCERLPMEFFSSRQSLLVEEGKCVMKRFVFNAAAISTLQERAKSQPVPYPSKVSVVSCFIWKSAMVASRASNSSKRPSLLLQAVNMRPRMVPPLTPSTIGNIFWFASAQCDVSEREIGLQDLVSRLNKAISQLDSRFLRKLQGDDGLSTIREHLQEVKEKHLKEKPETYTFTSWCNSDLNKVDFGWREPVWVCFVGWFRSGSRNVVILNDTTLGDGVEAWVAMNEKEMAILEQDPEFLALTSLNPSITIPVARL
ncbi:hypothetical protein RJ639_022286 [Escallonia herrerae]|uniref:Vinorine synthase n=1 Tax=Escallonia herrerae TaxID=1293975 RepID=A0AA88V4R0_9ASTE|nr:hypothetical protein RJ639_022286 [Escallonia herrerae]